MYIQYCDMWAMYCDRSHTVTGGPYTISNTMGAYQPYELCIYSTVTVGSSRSGPYARDKLAFLP